MLQTQIRIGKQVSHDRGDWDDILDIPTVETKNKKGDSITNYVLTLIFNLDTKTVEVSPSELYEYDPEQSPERFFNIKIQGAITKLFIPVRKPKSWSSYVRRSLALPIRKVELTLKRYYFEIETSPDSCLITVQRRQFQRLIHEKKD